MTRWILLKGGIPVHAGSVTAYTITRHVQPTYTNECGIHAHPVASVIIHVHIETRGNDGVANDVGAPLIDTEDADAMSEDDDDNNDQPDTHSTDVDTAAASSILQHDADDDADDSASTHSPPSAVTLHSLGSSSSSSPASRIDSTTRLSHIDFTSASTLHSQRTSCVSELTRFEQPIMNDASTFHIRSSLINTDSSEHQHDDDECGEHDDVESAQVKEDEINNDEQIDGDDAIVRRISFDADEHHTPPTTTTLVHSSSNPSYMSSFMSSFIDTKPTPVTRASLVPTLPSSSRTATPSSHIASLSR